MSRLALVGVSSGVLSGLVVAILLAAMLTADYDPASPKATFKAQADGMLRQRAGCFVPNLGQWQHAARFVHRSGPMRLFLEDRGWTLDLAKQAAGSGNAEVSSKTRHVALRMTFEGGTRGPDPAGERKLPGRHNYLLGNDRSCWRTGVPLYEAVRYPGLYPGIDLRLRAVNEVPEYDLLLEPGAELSLVIVHVEGGQGLSIAADGSLVIETGIGPLVQPRPHAMQVDGAGRRQEVACSFRLLGADRFGFAASDWLVGRGLIIDPGLIWSTLLGGRGNDWAQAVSVDGSGVVTVAGYTQSSDFPTTVGAYDRTANGKDAFVSRLDPRKGGSAQLVYSTFLGGSSDDSAGAVFADANGVVTVAGGTLSTDYPTTKAAYDTTASSAGDCFVTRLDPSKNGSAQLVYSTLLGGNLVEYLSALAVDAGGAVTVAGSTWSGDFPTTSGGYDTTHSGFHDGFVTRLDLNRIGKAQLVYSTFLGGADNDFVVAMSVDARGTVTVAGNTRSTGFPTTSGAHDTTYGGGTDAFVSRLDPSKNGSSQLVYSSFLGGSAGDYAYALPADDRGVVTVAGFTFSTDFPTTSGAYDTTYNGSADVFVSRLLPLSVGRRGLVYSTLLGGSGGDGVNALSVDGSGVVTLAGGTQSADFPTTGGAYDTTINGSLDVFVSRLDPRRTRRAQLVHSTFLGGSGHDDAIALAVDAGGVVTLVGRTSSMNFPTTGGTHDATHNGLDDVFVSRLSMGLTLYADVHEVSISTGGTQKLTVDAGKAHAKRSYWVFGSVTGTAPGVTLASPIGTVNIPLNPDVWTDYTIALANTVTLTNTKGSLDASGTALAALNIPMVSLPSTIGLVLHHACLVYDAKNNFYLASNPVPVKLVK